MSKNWCRFINLPAFVFLCLCIVSLSQAEEHHHSRHPGSVWIVRHLLLSKDSIDTAIRDIREAGLGRVFLQVSGRLHSYYPSSILPVAEDLVTRGDLRDPLAYFVDEAKKAGIEVHVWINIFFAWSKENNPKSPEHPFNKHPEWFVHDPDGTSHREMSLSTLQAREIPGYFISPVHPGFMNLIQRYIEEIVARYDIDGVHLDYIRFPSRSSGFGKVERSVFERRYYVDPVSLLGDSSALLDSFGPAGRRDLSRRWIDFRAGLVTEFVRSLREHLSLSGQKILLSAAVIPDPDSARVIYGQDWTDWLDEGLLDFSVIMSYTPDRDDFLAYVSQGEVVTRADRIVVGISTYNQRFERVIEKAQIALDRGFSGVSFFSYNDLKTKKNPYPIIRNLIGRAGNPRQ